MKTTITLLAAAALTASAFGQVNLVEIARVDLGQQFNSTTSLGTNPSAVAWNGSSAWIAGYVNGPSDTGTSGIVRIGSVLSAPSAGTPFGVVATPASRGYSGLDVNGPTLASAFDFGSASANGVQAWNAGDGTNIWSKNARGGSGVGFDPGFNGNDSGVAWTTFGSGRRALQNTATGADIYTTANGMIINDGAGTFWRDMDFNPATGDLFARRSNGLIKTTRTGGNSGTASTLIAFAAAADFVNGHNLAVMGDSPFGDIIAYNDRLAVSAGQSFQNVVKIVNTSGLAQNISWDFLGGNSPADGNGYYSFDYDAASQTLAVVDFFNRSLHVFQVPAPTSAAILAMGGLLAARRRR
jgi:hypothetical protein